MSSTENKIISNYFFSRFVNRTGPTRIASLSAKIKAVSVPKSRSV